MYADPVRQSNCVRDIPEVAIPNVLKVLAQAVYAEGRMPPQAANPAQAYRDFAAVFEQQRLM